jgi:hypothetical protein
MSGCDSRQPHHSIFDFRFPIGDLLRSPKSHQTGRAPAVQPNLQNSACVGQHHSDLPNRKSKIGNHKFILGPWLKSEAPALQAVPSGSVTRRTPPISIHCGKLDQSTEMSLINSLRWVQLPLPLPVNHSTSLGTKGNCNSLKPAKLTGPLEGGEGVMSGNNSFAKGAIIFSKRLRTAWGRDLNPRSMPKEMAASSISTDVSACFVVLLRE